MSQSKNLSLLASFIDALGGIRNAPRVTNITTWINFTPNSDTTDQFNVTALSNITTFNAPTGSPIDGQKLTIRIKDAGTSMGISWNTGVGGYRVIGVALPIITTPLKVIYVGCIYNDQDNYWDVVSVTEQA